MVGSKMAAKRIMRNISKFIEEKLGLKIKIDTSIEEPEALITALRMSEEVNKIVDYIGRLNGNRW